MSRLIAALAAAALVIGTAAPVSADFNPLRTVKKAVDLGLDTAHRAVDLGLDTAEGAFDVAKDAVTPDKCRPGKYYKGADGRWYECH